MQMGVEIQKKGITAGYTLVSHKCHLIRFAVMGCHIFTTLLTLQKVSF